MIDVLYQRSSWRSDVQALARRRHTGDSQLADGLVDQAGELMSAVMSFSALLRAASSTSSSERPGSTRLVILYV
jgi:hypothetical protein